MKNRSMFTVAMIAVLLLGVAGTAQSGVIVESSSFNGVTASDAAISTTGLVDWGYINDGGLFDNNYNNTLWDNIDDGDGTDISTAAASSSNGDVTLTELGGDDGIYSVESIDGTVDYTFDGTKAYGSFGGFAGTEDDIWSMTFNDLGEGTFDIVLYLGHSSSDSNFSIDVGGTGLTPFSDRTDDEEGISEIQDFGGLSFGNRGGVHFTYNITVTTTASTDDLTFTFNSIEGGAGEGLLSGYTVAIPEPATLGLLGICGLAIARYRRKFLR